MSISYPLALPTVTRGFQRASFRMRSMTGMTRSPFTGEQQTYVHPAQWWEAAVEYAPLKQRADAEAVVAFLLALNGMEGSFLMGDPLYTTVRGTWQGGSPLVNGASQTGNSLAVDGLSAGATVKGGDWFQLSSGASARLHRVRKDATANGFGQVTLDIWPRLRESPADNAALTIASPKGRWMLMSNDQEYTVERAQVYGFGFECVEDLRPL